MGWLNEFKKFVQRGNVIDLAVGIIMGAAFTGIVNSLVKDVITPPIGYLIKGADFTKVAVTLPQKIVMMPDPLDSGLLKPVVLEPATIKVGSFLQASLSFLITAFCVFLLVKGFNALMRHQSTQPPAPEAPPQEKLLREIRDLLQQQMQGRAAGGE
jgi:large conductance mechanosensitive channel